MGEHAHVDLSITLLFAGVLAAMIATLALEEKLRAKKSLITGVFAVFALVLGSHHGILPVGPVVNVFGEALTLPVYVPGVDWEVIAIIVGSSLFVEASARSGLFTWLAIKVTKLSRGNPRALMTYYGVMTVVFSALLNNVTAMIIVGSLTAVSLKKLQRSELMLGFLLVEGLLTNVGGLLTLISSVPNIIVGNAAGIVFMKFVFVAAPYVVAATVATILLGNLLFKISAPATGEARERAQAQVEAFDERDGIHSQGFFLFSAAMTLAFVVCIAITPSFELTRNLGMGYVAMAFGVGMLIAFRGKVDMFYREVDWDLIFFFVFLFVIINVMEHAQVLGMLGKGVDSLWALGEKGATGCLLLGSAVASAVTDNIPLAAMLAKTLKALDLPSTHAAWWAVIFGSNLGGNLTPIGSASTVVAVTVMNKHGLSMNFARFVVLALPFAVMQILLATAYVLFTL